MIDISIIHTSCYWSKSKIKSTMIKSNNKTSFTLADIQKCVYTVEGDYKNTNLLIDRQPDNYWYLYLDNIKLDTN